MKHLTIVQENMLDAALAYIHVTGHRPGKLNRGRVFAELLTRTKTDWDSQRRERVLPEHLDYVSCHPLSISYSWAQKHGWEIDFERHDGKNRAAMTLRRGVCIVRNKGAQHDSGVISVDGTIRQYVREGKHGSDAGELIYGPTYAPSTDAPRRASAKRKVGV